MSYKIYLFLLLTSLAGFSRETVSSGILTQCGQTLTVTDEAKIEYKVGKPYGKDELCAWVIRFEQADSIKFEIESQGIASGAKIVVASIQANTAVLSTILTSTEMNKPVTLKGTIAVVTFSSSSPSVGTGFILNLTRIGTQDTIVSTRSVTQIQTGPGTIKHPIDEPEYDRNGLSVFIIAPVGFATTCKLRICVELNVTSNSLGDQCHDRVDIFDYQHQIPGGWLHRKELCEADLQSYFPMLESLVLIVFSSHGAGRRGEGFAMEYVHYG